MKIAEEEIREADLTEETEQEEMPRQIPQEDPAGETEEEFLELPEEELKEEDFLPDQPIRIRKPLRPEWIMAIIAGVCALVLAVMVVICLPYFGAADEDPEALPERHEPQRVTEAVLETILEETVPETQPENPTIPPDRNPYDRYDFQYNRHNYLLLQNVHSEPGVDVSAYQGNIDWQKVKQSGITFAIVRLGYRGYESGKLVKDDYAVKNLEGARAAGLKVGAYFFSQALSIKEADEEIAFMMDVLDGFLPDMPLVLDWEIPTSDARTAKMDARTLTDIQLHYCKVIREKGYEPMIYFNWHQSENLYYLSELEDYPFWLALYQDRMTYPWKVEMWQYTCTGKVPGIQGDVDINVYMPY